MTGKTHAVIGANVVWLTAAAAGPGIPVMVAIGALAGLLPDLDAEESKAKHLAIPLRIGRVRIPLKPLFLPAVLIARLTRHRGFFHSLVALILVGAGAALLDRALGTAFALTVLLGYASHIALDMLTPGGVQLLWPQTLLVRLLPRTVAFRTGGLLDGLLFAVGTLALLLYLVQYVNTLGGSLF